jgi:hypothetical protein
MKRRVTQVMEVVMAPFLILIGRQMSVTGSVGNGLQIIRGIFSQISRAFYSFLEPFYKRFVYTAYQVMAITQRLNMAYQRINTIVLAFVYSGLTIIRGMINVKDFIIKVVLIILGIMVALIIVLFFVLAPFIGTIIIPVIGIISAAVGGAAVGGMADAFCLAPETPIQLDDGTIKSISALRIGDKLKDGGCVQSIIITTGDNVELWNIGGNLISSYHIVWDAVRSVWCFAKDHGNAVKTSETRKTLYCLNTESRIFQTESGLIVRDWEELRDTDKIGNLYYEAMVYSHLNKECMPNTRSVVTKEHGLDLVDIMHNFPTAYLYKVVGDGACDTFNSEPKIGDKIYDSQETLTTVVGLANTEVEYIWVRIGDASGYSFQKINLKNPVRMILPLTESGRLAIFHKNNTSVHIISDFTEIGSKNLFKTYDYILSRLLLE